MLLITSRTGDLLLGVRAPAEDPVASWASSAGLVVDPTPVESRRPSLVVSISTRNDTGRSRPFRRTIYRLRVFPDHDTIGVRDGRIRIAPSGDLHLFLPEGAFRAGSPTLTELLDVALTQAFARCSVAVLHGASISIPTRTLLLLGDTHSGKSTLSAAATLVGGRILSDDAVRVHIDANGRLEARPHRRDVVVREPTKPLFPEHLGQRLAARSAWDGQRWVLTRESAPEVFVDSSSPTGTWIVSIDRRLKESRCTGLDHAGAMVAVMGATSSLFLTRRYPLERAKLLPVLAAIASCGPAHRIRLGRDLVERPAETLLRLFEETA